MRGPLTLLLPIFLVVGCGGDSPKKSTFEQVASVKQDMAKRAPAAKEAAGQRDLEGKDDPAAVRKIIYTARMELIVEDLDQAEEALNKLLLEYKAYVARSERSGSPGSSRRGTWTIRVPAANFEEARKAIDKLGESRRNALESDDITDRYFDTQAEMLNLEAREKALRKLYEEKIAGTKLADLLEVDRELNRVRGEINQRKGQLQRWDKETAFSTIQLEMYDRRGYVPPTSPAFNTQIGRTFEGSLTAMLEVGKWLVLAAVAVAPWVVVLLIVIGLPLWGIVRLTRTKPADAPPPLPAETNG